MCACCGLSVKRVKKCVYLLVTDLCSIALRESVGC